MNNNKKPKSFTLGDLLDELAAKYGEREAVIWNGNRVDYNNLKKQADTFARALLKIGIRPGDHVALLCSNRLEWLTAAFAIGKIGAITVAVSTFSTDRELEWTLKHSEARCLITISSIKNQNFIKTLKRLCPEYKTCSVGSLKSSNLPNLRTIISINGDTDGAIINWTDVVSSARSISSDFLSKKQSLVKKEDVCFILYTSGSTAEPKGVMLAHGNVIANGFDIGERQNLSTNDRLWFAVPLFWSFGSANAMPALLTHGGCLVLQDTFEPLQALELIEREKCTVFYGMINMVRALRENPNWSPRKVKSMRTGLTIGLPEDIQIMIDTLDAAELCNVYGSTETYGNAAVCSSYDALELRLNSQGLPLPGMQIRAIDVDTREPLANGNVGELAVSGYVTPGYFRNPEATKSAFDSEGYFLTGDLGMIGHDGRVYFKGRLKEMIKTGGINVAPLEVEEVLMRNPQVKQTFVFGLPDPIKEEKVVAVVEPETGSDIDIEKLRMFCRQELAPYKVPLNFIVRLNDSLPRTATGKINKPELKTQIENEMSELESGV